MSTADDAIKAAAPTGIQRLLTRGLPTHVHHLRAAPVDETEAAQQAVKDAREALELASIRLDDGANAARQAAEGELAAARERLAACYEPVKVRALAPVDFEALAAKYKDEKRDTGVDQDSLGRAAFLAGVQGDLSLEEWAAVLDQCSYGERSALYVVALALNSRVTDGSVPKG